MIQQIMFILVLGVLFLHAEEIPECEYSAPHMEPPCAKAGGQCLPADECPQGQLSEVRGLCPQQQSAGVECCYGLSIREHRCSKRGGQCLPKTRCGRQLVDDRAEDCGPGEVCCILV